MSTTTGATEAKDGKMPTGDASYQLEKNNSTNIGDVQDIGLSRLGLESQTTRNMSLLSIMAVGWNISNSWAAIAATLALSIASGGPVTLIYGIVIIFLLSGSCALSMAEIASVYPTSGGQYHYTSILAPQRFSKVLSYVCGCLNLFGWIVTSASFVITIPQMITGLASYWNTTYVAEKWHVFLIYQAINFIFTAYNLFLAKRTLWVYDIGFFLSLAGYFVIVVTCLALSHPKQSSEFVWTSFTSTTGWSNKGIVFLTGLINPNFIYSGLDGAIHLAEECTNPTVVVPFALLSTIIIGFITAFSFSVAMTYSYHDFDAVLASPFPILEIWNQATSSLAAATVFQIILLLSASFAVAGCIQTSSRLTWSFARDDAIFFSRFLGRIHTKLDVPVWALLGNSSIVAILGSIYLGSVTAFNALIGTGLILQQLSFAIPAALVIRHRLKGRDAFNAVLSSKDSKRFGLHPVVGYVANILTIVLGLIALVFYNFPTELPATGGNMNYACVILGVCGLFGCVNWFWYARKHYHGPRLHD